MESRLFLELSEEGRTDRPDTSRLSLSIKNTVLFTFFNHLVVTQRCFSYSALSWKALSRFTIRRIFW